MTTLCYCSYISSAKVFTLRGSSKECELRWQWNSDGTNQQKLLPPTGMPPEMISFPGVGITPEAQAMVASLSVDETVQLHKVHLFFVFA